jgi:hypothetical protein
VCEAGCDTRFRAERKKTKTANNQGVFVLFVPSSAF